MFMLTCPPRTLALQVQAAEFRDSMVLARIFLTDPSSDIWDTLQLPGDEASQLVADDADCAQFLRVRAGQSMSMTSAEGASPAASIHASKSV